MGKARDDRHLAVVLAHLCVVVEVDVCNYERAMGAVDADAANELGHQRGAALLEQLVVDGWSRWPSMSMSRHRSWTRTVCSRTGVGTGRECTGASVG